MKIKDICNVALLTLPFLALGTGFTSCSSLEDDDHYGNNGSVIKNDQLKIVDQTSEAYLASRSDLSKMNELFTSEGVYDELRDKGQLSTILIVKNDNFSSPVGDKEYINYVTRSHVSDISMSPSNLTDGERIMMWHNKYVNVSMDEEGQAGLYQDHIFFNNASVKEIIKTTNGYVYVISDMINTPTSLMDFINELGDDYSLFRDAVLSTRTQEFDRAHSKPVGINAEGNTVYDSVFVYKNEYFESVNFDMNSESITATMLLFSNNVVQAALNDAHARLSNWGMEDAKGVRREAIGKDEKGKPIWLNTISRAEMDKIIKQWIVDVAFFNQRYSVTDLMSSDKELYQKSIFGRQWGAGYNTINSESIELSNATVFEVKNLRIPNNVLIYRLKEWFYYYENCTEEQKEKYFTMSNMLFNKVGKDEVAAWTPLSGVWPEHADHTLLLKPGDEGSSAPFSLDFTPLRLTTNSDGAMVAEPFLIPPGKYRLAMGFKQNANLTITVTVLARRGNTLQAIQKSDEVILGSATTYHYDRGATLSNSYPEGYNPKAEGLSSKASNYSTDGGPIITELNIPDLDGNDNPLEVVFRIEANTWNGNTGATFTHWCLRPTDTNY